MIKLTLEKTKEATFAVVIPHPNPDFKEFPTPNGTGFFIDPEGYFITARHVVQKIGLDGNPILNTVGIPDLFDISKLQLIQPSQNYKTITNLSLVSDFPQFDLVILKADFEQNKKLFEGKSGFDFLDIEFSIIPEGEEVYAFGYPLAEHSVQLASQPGGVMTGTHTYFPRTTSLIVASHYDKVGFLISPGFPKYYVIDKALNYGNSGGPIIVCSTGKAISVCTRFQPVMIKQSQGAIMVPSLYGITVSLKNIQKEIDALKNK